MFILLHHLLVEDNTVFAHERYRVQLHFIMLIMAYTSSRAGALVESTAYKGTNQGLIYSDFVLALHPNPAGRQERNLISLEMKLRFLKGKRQSGVKLVSLAPCYILI